VGADPSEQGSGTVDGDNQQRRPDRDARLEAVPSVQRGKGEAKGVGRVEVQRRARLV
jgi:hypothetical protein